ncbi:CLUMA_CG001474, isoform A [Clunio marinus]|uniref:CLUMA_CG001474, isoform A n=1 Tax=Clunio marinus TaxID=568069 RepID=A0A1J1HIF2_9DIPT|nr:CLUMA_CG001474, isoform A [Clunio marinus]
MEQREKARLAWTTQTLQVSWLDFRYRLSRHARDKKKGNTVIVLNISPNLADDLLKLLLLNTKWPNLYTISSSEVPMKFRQLAAINQAMFEEELSD